MLLCLEELRGFFRSANTFAQIHTDTVRSTGMCSLSIHTSRFLRGHSLVSSIIHLIPPLLIAPLFDGAHCGEDHPDDDRLKNKTSQQRLRISVSFCSLEILFWFVPCTWGNCCHGRCRFWYNQPRTKYLNVGPNSLQYSYLQMNYDLEQLWSFGIVSFVYVRFWEFKPS